MSADVMTDVVVGVGVGVGPFRFGMTRDEVWGLTRSTVVSFFAQQWSLERIDDVRDLAVHLDYTEGRVVRIVAFTSNRPYRDRCPVTVEGVELGPDSGVDDVIALCELFGWAWERDSETVDVRQAGVRFGFVERDERQQLEWIAITGDRDAL